MNVTKTSEPRQRKPRTKPARSIGVVLPMNEQGKNGVIKITVGQKTDEYSISRLTTDFGKGFQVEKIGLECTENAYHVNIDGEKRTCTCKGNASHGHCKHADGLAALIAAKRL